MIVSATDPLHCPHLRASDVVRFVQRQVPRLHPKRAKLLTSALRSFLQYVRYRDKAKLDLAAAVPVVANWSMYRFPGRLRRTKSVSCWPASIGALR
jgi:integrase/recombinase XerD